MKKKKKRENKVKISVIMGVYNPKDKKQLRDAIQSIINQTMKEWELIMCDDCSESEYLPLIQEVIAMDNRIIYIRNKCNMGLGYSLNRCLNHAKGQYIARMDDDDISEPERFQKEYDFLEKHGEYQWVGSNSMLFHAGGIWGEDKMPVKPEAEDFLAYSPYIHPSIMFRSNVLRNAGGYPVSAETRRCEDYELFMRLHQEGYQGYNIQEPLLRYREDGNTYKKRTFESRIQEMKIRYQGFRNLGLLRMKNIGYVIKPLAAGIIPSTILGVLRESMRKNHHVIKHAKQM